MPKRTQTFSASALVAVLLLLVGCGGGGDSSLSKSEFIKRADAICKKADETQAGEAAAYQKAHLKEFVKLPVNAQIEQMVPILLLPSIQREIEGIEALGIPSGDERQINDFLAEAKKALDKAEQNPATLEASRGAEGPFRGPDQLGREYGFKACDEIT
jgi:hypothetical protein